MISKEQHKEEMQRPEVLRSCYNCAWIVAYVSLWCSNDDAIEDRGTRIPGCIHCPHWSPDRSARKIMNRNKKNDNFMTVD